MKSNADNYAEELQIKLTVNREAWSRVQSFKDSGPDDRHYVAVVDERGATTIKFGDGEKGRIPPAGSKIAATYRYGSGAAGNVKKRRTRSRAIKGK